WFRSDHESTDDRSIPRNIPSIGEITMPRIGKTQPDGMIAAVPALAIAAPANPPSSACDDDDGNPKYQVIRFQLIAPSSAAHSSVGVTTVGSMSPLEIVLATAVPTMNAARKLNDAAHATATPGDSTRVATTVAIELALSWKPLMKSKISAMTTTASTKASD